MPVVTTVDKDKQLTIHTLTGEVVFDEIMATLKKFWESASTVNWIWDFREGTMTDVGEEEVNEIVSYVMIHGKPGKTAFVASGGLDYGMARMTSAYTEIKKSPRETEVFRSMDEALQWFGISE
jgi:hypothetical protein